MANGSTWRRGFQADRRIALQSSKFADDSSTASQISGHENLAAGRNKRRRTSYKDTQGRVPLGVDSRGQVEWINIVRDEGQCDGDASRLHCRRQP
jgi:hypothetical protein